MDVKELRGLLADRLYLELQLFKDSKLRQEKEEIFRASYEIEIYVNLFEILLVQIEKLQEDAIRKWLGFPSGILESIYRGWLGVEDRFYEELAAYACGRLENLMGTEIQEYREEESDGTGFDQAA
mgnify:CR=1 FL=1